MWICGVEEAGRGPVLGPMVMACCWVKAEDEELLRKAGAKDSKLLTPMQREGMLKRLIEMKEQGTIGFNLIILSPAEIDAAVEGATDNLNKLELRTSAVLINQALKSKQGKAIRKALIDCPTKNTVKYATDIKELLEKKIEVIAEHKADVNYPVVSAASIIAKVTRDAEIEKIKEWIGKNTGSGYPADPFTQDFLRHNYLKKEYSILFRKSWATYKELVEQGKQSKLFQFGKKKERKKREEGAFATLKEHGFTFEEPKSQYEVFRVRGMDAIIIKYTTGKLLIQGRGKAAAERLLKRLKLV